MSVVGGSIVSISLGPDLRKFDVTADCEVQRKIGGFENDVQSFGSGNARIVKTRVPLALDGIIVGIDDDTDDHEYLQRYADATTEYPFNITLANGSVWQGRGIITDELQYNTMQATAQFSIKGGGVLTKQV